MQKAEQRAESRAKSKPPRDSIRSTLSKSFWSHLECRKRSREQRAEQKANHQDPPWVLRSPSKSAWELLSTVVCQSGAHRIGGTGRTATAISHIVHVQGKSHQELSVPKRERSGLSWSYTVRGRYAVAWNWSPTFHTLTPGVDCRFHWPSAAQWNLSFASSASSKI